jgi:predicted phosphodiesterase
MIYITGDTHIPINVKKLGSKVFTAQKDMTKADYLIVCGDFGAVWHGGREQEYWLKWLEDKPFTTLFVDGNHENFDLLYAYPVETWNGGKIHRVNDSVYHLMRGQVFTIDAYKFFTMGGAYSIDKEYRKPFVSWWPQEMPTYAECEEGLRNLEAHGNTVDYIVTHTAPYSVIRRFYDPLFETPHNQYLETVRNTVTFRKWYIGHLHRDMEIGEQFRLLYHDVIKVE